MVLHSRAPCSKKPTATVALNSKFAKDAGCPNCQSACGWFVGEPQEPARFTIRSPHDLECHSRFLLLVMESVLLNHLVLLQSTNLCFRQLREAMTGFLIAWAEARLAACNPVRLSTCEIGRLTLQVQPVNYSLFLDSNVSWFPS